MEGKWVMFGEVQPSVYPAPLLSHVEVSVNPAAFMDTLRRFHAALGTRFTIPVIGGKELDLHQLYVQVTQRGGLEKVILERRWKEVIATFNFPPTTTSASFVLRKYYLNILHHYEQVYFFRNQGYLISPSAILQTRTSPSKLDHSPPSVCESNMRRKRPLPPRPSRVVPPPPQTVNGHEFVASDSVPRPPAPKESRPATVVPPPPQTANGHEFVASGSVPRPPSPKESRPATVAQSVPQNVDGNGVAASGPIPIALTTGESTTIGNVSGVIDGKFEHGYFVTVKIGSQILHGVLYHVHPTAAAHSSRHEANNQPSGASSSSAPAPSNAIVPYIPPIQPVQRRRRYKNSEPSYPKPNRSAYNYFFAEKHSKLKLIHPHQEREYSRMIAESWNKLTDEERKVYDDYGRRDRARYRRELQEYMERMGLMQPREVVRENEVVNEVAKAREVVREKEVGKGKGKEVDRAESSNLKNEG